MQTLLSIDPTQHARFKALFELDRELGQVDAKTKHKFLYLFFRVMGPRLQQRFTELTNADSIPRAFLHGNPHVDNYSRTLSGAGMVDFDRSRIGPYLWDFARFFCSLNLRSEEFDPHKSAPFLPKKVGSAFLDGYMMHFQEPHMPFHEADFLRKIRPANNELSIKGYLHSGKKWAKKMRANPLSPQDPFIQSLLKSYHESSGKHYPKDQFKVEEAGSAEGSLGINHYLIVLAPISPADKTDHIFLDIKNVYDEANTRHFHNPFEHHGVRMNEAAKLYAPGVERGLGHAQVKGVQYWAREISPFNAKIKGQLNANQLVDLAFAVGSQLGRGHRLSLRETSPRQLETHLTEHFDQVIELSSFLNRELMVAFDFFSKSLELQKEFSLHRA